MTGENHSLGKDENSRKQGLREILIEQYLLHEVQHHPTLHGPAEPQFVESNHGNPLLCGSLEQQDADHSAPEIVHFSNGAPQEPKIHTLADIYKCLHQGEFGIGHSIHNMNRFRSRLEQEMFVYPPVADEPLIEIISTDRRVARLNLRPFRHWFANDITHAVGVLAEICLESARTVKGDSGRFLQSLYDFRELNAAKELRVGRTVYIFEPRSVDDFLLSVKELARELGEVPVFSHSRVYRETNAPAYRVIDLQVLAHSQLGGPIVDLIKKRCDL